jgi:HAD superfamily hydrolase (TIGR01459 family)
MIKLPPSSQYGVFTIKTALPNRFHLDREGPAIQLPDPRPNQMLATNPDTIRISGLAQIAASYDLVLCDVWGVLHNGIRPRQGAIEALTSFRQAGGTVIMITNAPRQRKSVYVQLQNMGVPDNTFDNIVTSGDVTRDLLRAAPRRMLHIGPAKDLNLFEGIDLELVSEKAAEAIICSGLWNETTESPADYIELLTRLKSRNLPLICANPDLVVEVGDHLEYCAGSIALEYSKLGGKTLIAGKPHHPIYDVAIAEAENLAKRKFDRKRILAIGDGMPTDIKGAADYGIDALYVSAGIHAGEYGEAEDPDHAGVIGFLGASGVNPMAYLPRLVW